MALSPRDSMDLLDRRLQRVLRLEGAEFLLDARHLLVEGWLGKPKIRPYAVEMINDYREHERLLHERLRELRPQMKEFRARLIEAVPEASDEGAAGQRFRERRGEDWDQYSLEHFDDLAEKESFSADDYIESYRPDDPYSDLRSIEREMLHVLATRIGELNQVDSNWDRSGKGRTLKEHFDHLDGRVRYEVRHFVDWQRASAEAALYRVLVALMGLLWAPEASGLDLDENEIKDTGLELAWPGGMKDLLYEPHKLDEKKSQALEDIEVFKRDLERAHEGLAGRIGGTLDALIVIDRYKTRAELYRRPEMRRIVDDAEQNAATRKKNRMLEDRLTRDLCAYLFDEGHLPLYRLPAGESELDIVSVETLLGTSSLLVEAKAYRRSMRQEIIGGVAQCVSYLSRMSSRTTGGVYEIFYVVFRVEGPLYALPDQITYGPYRIFPRLVDLSDAKTSGHKQAKSRVTQISEKDILQKIEETIESANAPGGDDSSEYMSNLRILRSTLWRFQEGT